MIRSSLNIDRDNAKTNFPYSLLSIAIYVRLVFDINMNSFLTELYLSIQ